MRSISKFPILSTFVLSLLIEIIGIKIYDLIYPPKPTEMFHSSIVMVFAYPLILISLAIVVYDYVKKVKAEDLKKRLDDIKRRKIIQ
jgi:hypothetical protein